MRDYLFARWTINDFALVGVDGGAKWACSSWAVVLDDESYGSAIEGEDATPCTAELLAILLALEAVAGALCELDFARVTKFVDIVSDCKPAISLAKGGFCSHDRYRSQRSILAAVGKCAAAKVVVNFVWVPSHNKFSKNFVVPAEHTEKRLRKLNAKADDRASTELATAIRQSKVEEWRRTYEVAVRWSRRALVLGAKRVTDFEEAMCAWHAVERKRLDVSEVIDWPEEEEEQPFEEENPWGDDFTDTWR
jgi:ribonuclease HI